jgi:hypothetical protein
LTFSRGCERWHRLADKARPTPNLLSALRLGAAVRTKENFDIGLKPALMDIKSVGGRLIEIVRIKVLAGYSGSGRQKVSNSAICSYRDPWRGDLKDANKPIASGSRANI